MACVLAMLLLSGPAPTFAVWPMGQRVLACGIGLLAADGVLRLALTTRMRGVGQAARLGYRWTAVVVMLALFAIQGRGWPIRMRFWLSRPDLVRAAWEVRNDRWTQGERRVGLFRIQGVFDGFDWDENNVYFSIGQDLAIVHLIDQDIYYMDGIVLRFDEEWVLGKWHSPY